MKQVKKFSNNKAILVNGKAILYYVKLDGACNRMTVARKMFNEYKNHFSTVGEVIEMIRAYEKAGDFHMSSKSAYILHQA